VVEGLGVIEIRFEFPLISVFAYCTPYLSFICLFCIYSRTTNQGLAPQTPFVQRPGNHR
jgi:hypothetical protein